jgi:hypothetical protein
MIMLQRGLPPWGRGGKGTYTCSTCTDDNLIIINLPALLQHVPASDPFLALSMYVQNMPEAVCDRTERPSSQARDQGITSLTCLPLTCCIAVTRE